MAKVHRIPKYNYLIYNRNGELIYDGSLEEVADEFCTTTNNVYFRWKNNGLLLNEFFVKRIRNRVVSAKPKKIREALLQACRYLEFSNFNTNHLTQIELCTQMIEEVSDD